MFIWLIRPECFVVIEYSTSTRAQLVEDLSKIMEAYVEFIKLKVLKPSSRRVSTRKQTLLQALFHAFIYMNYPPKKMIFVGILQKSVDYWFMLVEEWHRIPCLYFGGGKWIFLGMPYIHFNCFIYYHIGYESQFKNVPTKSNFFCIAIMVIFKKY